MTATVDHERRFWSLADPLLDRPNVTRSTMMGLPCLRVDGAFFASWDRNSGALLVKLPEARVDELVAAGHAEPFAPAGRRFREWAAIPNTRTRTWHTLTRRSPPTRLIAPCVQTPTETMTRSHGRSAEAPGIRMRNWHPSLWFRTSICPACASTRPRAIARPSPPPPPSRPRAASPRKAVSNTRSISVSGMPPHSSSTDSTIASASAWPSRTMTPPRWVWRTALSSRLRSARVTSIAGTNRLPISVMSHTTRMPLTSAACVIAVTASSTSSCTGAVTVDDSHRARLNAAEHEEVIDKRGKPFTFEADRLVVAGPVSIVGCDAVLECLGKRSDRRERAAQVVRNPRHQLSPRPIERLFTLRGMIRAAPRRRRDDTPSRAFP